MKSITILVVSFFSFRHINRLFKNLYEKAEQPKNINFLIVDNTNGKDKDLPGLMNIHENVSLIFSSGENRQRSISHSIALDKGLKASKGIFTLIIDPDVYIFKKHWDTFFVNKLKINRKSILGAPYPQWKVGKIHDFPSVVLLFFRTLDIQKLNTSFYPFPGTLVRLKNSIIRKFIRFGIIGNKNFLNKYFILRKITKQLEKLTGISSPDTGNKIIEVLRKNNVIPICFKAKYSNDIKSENNLFRLAREYEVFFLNDELIMTHMYGSGVFYWKTKKGSDIRYWTSLITQIEKSKDEHFNKK